MRLSFRIFKDRGRWIVRSAGASRQATPEEVALWHERQRVKIEVNKLRELAEAGKQADAIAELSRVARRHCYEALRSQGGLTKAAKSCADALRLAALRLPRGLYQTQARDAASAVTGAIERAVKDAAIAWRELGIEPEPDGLPVSEPESASEPVGPRRARRRLHPGQLAFPFMIGQAPAQAHRRTPNVA